MLLDLCSFFCSLSSHSPILFVFLFFLLPRLKLLKRQPNQESVCAEAASFQLTTVSLNRCIEQIETCIQLGNESPLTLEANDLRKEDLVFLKGIFFADFFKRSE